MVVFLSDFGSVLARTRSKASLPQTGGTNYIYIIGLSLPPAMTFFFSFFFFFSSLGGSDSIPFIVLISYREGFPSLTTSPKSVVGRMKCFARSRVCVTLSTAYATLTRTSSEKGLPTIPSPYLPFPRVSDWSASEAANLRPIRRLQHRVLSLAPLDRGIAGRITKRNADHG